MIQNYEVIGKDAFNPIIHKSAGQVMRKLAGNKADNAIKLGNKTYKTGQLATRFESRFGTGDWKHIADIGDAISEGRSGLKLKDFIKKGTDKIDYGAKAGQWVEQQQKMVAYIGSLKQGKSIDEALELAEKAGFDYSKITPFEAKIMRRLIPFYTFTRKNIELQAKTLLEHPERISNVIKGFRAVGEQPTEEDLAGLPDYVKQGFVSKTGRTDEYGRPLFKTAGGTPIEQAGQQISGNIPLRIASQTNPILKWIIEGSTGIDTFRSAGGEITKTAEVTSADRYAKAPKLLKDFLKMTPTTRATYVNNKKVGEREGYNADPERLRLLNSLPTSRFVNVITGLFDPTKKTETKALDALTGIKQYASDKEQQEYWTEKRNKEALINLLERIGAVKTFEKPYIPKGKK